MYLCIKQSAVDFGNVLPQAKLFKKAEINLLALCEPHLRILLQRGLEMQKSFKFKQHLRTVLQIKSTQTLYECLQSAALILLFIGRHIAKLDSISAFIFSKLCINPCCMASMSAGVFIRCSSLRFSLQTLRTSKKCEARDHDFTVPHHQRGI